MSLSAYFLDRTDGAKICTSSFFENNVFLNKLGRWLECFTDQPGVQFYTGNFIPTNDSLTGKDGAVYR